MKTRIFWTLMLAIMLAGLSACGEVAGNDVVYEPSTTRDVNSTITEEPTGQATEPATEAAGTATEVSTEVAAGAPTAIPSPSPTAIRDTITLENLGKISLGSIAPLEFKKVDLYGGRWGTARWTLNGGKYLVVETDKGVDVLDGLTLALTKSYPGYKPVDLLNGGGFAALKDKDLVFIDPANDSVTTKSSVIVADVVATSRNGQYVAFAATPTSVILIDTNTQDRRTIELNYPQKISGITDLLFQQDSAALYVITQDISKRAVSFFIDTTYGTQVYSVLLGTDSPLLSPDARHYIYQDKQTIYYARPNNTRTGQAVDANLGIFTSIPMVRVTINGQKNASAVLVGRSFSFTGVDNQIAILYNGQRYFGENRSNYQRYDPPQYAVDVWDLYKLERVKHFDNLGTIPLQFGFSQDGTRFYTISFDGIFRSWKGDTGDAIAVSNLEYATFNITPDLSPDGSKYIVPTVDGFKIFDSKTQGILTYNKFPENEAMFQTRAQFATNSIVGAETEQWHLIEESGATIYKKYFSYTWDLNTNQPIRKYDDTASCYYNINGTLQTCNKVLTYGELKAIQIIDIASGQPLQTAAPDAIDYVDMSPDGSSTAYCAIQNERIFTLLLQGENNIPTPYNFPCQDMRYLPDNSALLLADGTVVGLASRDVVMKFTFARTYETLPTIYFSPNKDFILVGFDLYNWKTGAYVKTIDGPQKIYGAALVDDGLSLLLLTDRGLESWNVSQ